MRDPEIAKHLSGKVRFLAVPAEELLELGYREDLRKQGVIRYFGGKVEFLYRGYLDGIDAAFMVHTAAYDRMSGFPALRPLTRCVRPLWTTTISACTPS